MACPADVSSNQDSGRLDESNSCDGLRFPSFGEIGRDHGSNARVLLVHAAFSQLTRVSRDKLNTLHTYRVISYLVPLIYPQEHVLRRFLI